MILSVISKSAKNLNHISQGVTETFLSYFGKKVRVPLKIKVNEPFRKNMISAEWTNNKCECINHLLKLAVVGNQNLYSS